MNFKLLSFQNIFFVITLLFFNSSCNHKYYVPNEGDIVVLKKRNDVHISGSLKEGNISTSNIQLGYSPIKHVGLSGSFFNVSGKEQNNNQNNLNQSNDLKKGKGNIISGAIGGYYFFPFELNSTTNNYDYLKDQDIGILTDIYIGHAKGKVNNYYEGGGSTHFKFQKNYIQFGAHWMTRVFSLSYGFRVGKLNYYQGEVLGKVGGNDKLSFNMLNNTSTFKLLEDTFQIQIGGRKARIILTTTAVRSNDKLESLGIKKTNTTLGIIVEIDEFFNMKRKKKSKEMIDILN